MKSAECGLQHLGVIFDRTPYEMHLLFSERQSLSTPESMGSTVGTHFCTSALVQKTYAHTSLLN